MPFSNPAARAAFFEKLKMQGKTPSMGGSMSTFSTPNLGSKPVRSGLEANITPKMPNISSMKLPKISDNAMTSPMRFQKIKSYMKG